MEPKIVWRKISRQEWLNDIPDLIYYLKKAYNFYYNENVLVKTNDIKELVLRKHKKNKHKIIAYYNSYSYMYYLVVYCRDRIDIYYCDEYQGANWSVIKYFLNKFSLASKKAGNEDYEEEQLFTSEVVNSGRVQ